MNTIDHNSMKKIYTRPMIEIEQLVGTQFMEVSSLKVYTENYYNYEVNDYDDLLTGHSHLWDDEEDGDWN